MSGGENSARSSCWYPYARPVLAQLLAGPCDPKTLIVRVRASGVMGDMARQALAYLEELDLAFYQDRQWHAARDASLDRLREAALRHDPGASL